MVWNNGRWPDLAQQIAHVSQMLLVWKLKATMAHLVPERTRGHFASADVMICVSAGALRRSKNMAATSMRRIVCSFQSHSPPRCLVKLVPRMSISLSVPSVLPSKVPPLDFQVLLPTHPILVTSMVACAFGGEG